MGEYESLPQRRHAIRWTGLNTTELLGLKRLGDPSAKYYVEVDGPLDDPAPTGVLEVVTIDGNQVPVPVGHYVVLDTKGFPYPCDPEIFKSTNRSIR